jgi:hypothetical protein
MHSDTKLLIAILEKVNVLDNSLQETLMRSEELAVFQAGEQPALIWTLSKTDLIELIYALHSSGAFNKGTATIAQITRFFEHVLQIQLGNTSMVFQEILRRKDSTAFVDRLKKKLEEHIERIDERNLK